MVTRNYFFEVPWCDLSFPEIVVSFPGDTLPAFLKSDQFTSSTFPQFTMSQRDHGVWQNLLFQTIWAHLSAWKLFSYLFYDMCYFSPHCPHFLSGHNNFQICHPFSMLHRHGMVLHFQFHILTTTGVPWGHHSKQLLLTLAQHGCERRRPSHREKFLYKV